MNDGRNYIAEELRAKDAEIGRLRKELWHEKELSDALRNLGVSLAKNRAATIEECARVAETNAFSLTVSGGAVGSTIATAIRALKDKAP